MDEKTAQLDQEVAAAAAAWRDLERALRREGPAAIEATERDLEPLVRFRRVSSRVTYLKLLRREEGIGAELGLGSTASIPILGADGATPIPLTAALPAPDPISTALAAWVQHLTLERVLHEDRLRIAGAWHAPAAAISAGAARGAAGKGAPRGQASTTVSAREALLGLLAEPSAAPRRAWADALAQAAAPIAEAARIEAQRREEAARRLGVDEAAAPLDLPCDPPDAALRLAAELLDRTAPLLERVSTWDEAIARAVARDASEGWPARLSLRWLEELFRPAGLTEGLELDPRQLMPLPRALGASSFARALGRFGAALAEASAPRAAPFALARPPFDLRRARRAALFAGLPADPAFCARVLGLGRSRARDQARVTARALLLTLRLDAARARLLHGVRAGLPRSPLLLPRREGEARFEEETRCALGAPIPGALAGVVPDLRPGAALGFLGALLAARDRRLLIERHDEDWFKNPRAAEAIRGEESVFPAAPGLLAPVVPRPLASAAELEEGLAALLDHLSALG